MTQPSPAARIASGLTYLAAELSCTADEFRRDNQPQGAMLLEGLVNNGYARTQGGRYALSEAGRRRVHAEAPVDG